MAHTRSGPRLPTRDSATHNSAAHDSAAREVTTQDVTGPDVTAEWNRRAQRDGLARVMRASQPAALEFGVTEQTRNLVAGYLETVSARLQRPVTSALDVGCGIGRLTPVLAAQAERVVAIDMTPGMLAAAGRTCAGLDNVEFHRYEAQRLPWSSFRFDVAVCVWVLMHVLDDEQLATVCRGLARSARYLMLIEYEYAGVPVGPYSRVRPLDEYLALLPGARLLQRRDLHYGADRSFAALIGLEPWS